MPVIKIFSPGGGHLAAAVMGAMAGGRTRVDDAAALMGMLPLILK